MNRRSYLTAAAGAALALAGCVGSGAERDEGARTPYADAETDYEYDGDDPVTHAFEGEGSETTDTVSLTTSGPTVVELDHDGEEAFTVWFVDEDGERVELAYGAVGPFVGRSIHALDPGTYGLSVDADGAWTADVTELPVYESGESLPLELDGVLVDVVGPVDFPEGGEVTFSLSASDGAGHQSFLYDRHGDLVAEIHREEGDVDDASVTGDVSGVGYVFVESDGEWSLSITGA